MQREIAAHLQLLEDEYRARGLSEEEAKFAAQRAFGGVAQAQERQRETRSFAGMANWWLDLKLGGRMLAKYPGLTFVGGLGLTVGIAVTTFAYHALYVCLSPSEMPLPEGDRLVAIENWDTEINNQERRALSDFATWRTEARTLTEFGAFRMIGRNLLTPGNAIEAIVVAEINAAGMRAARVEPVLGRLFEPADENPASPPVLILSHEAWQRTFAGDSQILGREVWLSGVAHTVIGVMPEGFTFPTTQRYWTPLRLNPTDYGRREGPGIDMFARLAAGATMEQAQAELAGLGQRAAAAFPQSHEKLLPRVRGFATLFADDLDQFQTHLIQFLVTLLLLMVGANVAILVYARVATRQGELAVRTALGASRGRIIGQLFAEALVLAMLAAGFGLAVAQGALAYLKHLVGPLAPFWFSAALSPAAIAWALLAAMASAVVVGVIPAWRATGPGLQANLQRLGVDGRGIKLGKTWSMLVVMQVALAVAGLPATVLLGWKTYLTSEQKPGGVTAEVLIGRVQLDAELPAAAAEVPAFERDLDERFTRLQGELRRRIMLEGDVRDVTFAAHMPESEPVLTVAVAPANPAAAWTTDATFSTRFVRVDLQWIDALAIPLLAGRGFLPADTAPDAQAVIVNRSFADEVLGGGQVLGRRFRYVEGQLSGGVARLPAGIEPERWYEVVGLVGDFPRSANPDYSDARVYHAMPPGAQRPVVMAIRMSGPANAAMAARIRALAADLDPMLRIVRLEPFNAVWENGRSVMRLMAGALLMMTASVLLLSAAGIYAMMSFLVAQRRREIGIRAALGADAQHILLGVFARAAVQIFFGVAGGSVVALLLLRALDDGGGKPSDFLACPFVATVMAAVALAAAWVPARDGLKVSPLEALREN